MELVMVMVVVVWFLQAPVFHLNVRRIREGGLGGGYRQAYAVEAAFVSRVRVDR